MFQPFLLLCLLFHPIQTFSLLQSQNYSTHLCHNDEKIALLHFKKGFTINPSSSEMYNDVISSYPKTKSWKVNKDCCSWDGVICDSILGYVVRLDLSCSHLNGIIHSNSSLFHLSHLQTLNLAYNNFYPSSISPNFGNFSSLKHLNLSHTGFVGEVHIEIAHLTQLVLLDLTIPSLVGTEVEIMTLMNLPYFFPGLKIPHFHKITKNLTKIRLLHLNGILIDSSLPQNIANLSSLTSLQLFNCSLKGTFPSKILRLPHLQSLIVESNPSLKVHPSQLNNLSKTLEVLDFAYTNFSGRLPEYSLETQPSLRKFSVAGCNLFGTIPLWVWNTSQIVMLDHNHFNGELLSLINIKNFTNLQYITTIVLSNNLLKGTIPSWLFTLPYLIELNLQNNQFSSLDGSILTGINSNHQHSSSKIQFLDLSKNQLSGNILDFVANLVALNTLDISYNNVKGQIPITLANLTSLTYLDLSMNKLEGTFPPQLTPLLANLLFLNFSENRLVGRIPPQLGPRPEDSFKGNPGLCGPPLEKSCGNAHRKYEPVLPTYQQENDFLDVVTRINLWKIILMGFGIGTILGFVIGICMLYTLTPLCFSRKVDKIEYLMVERLKKRRRRQRRTNK